MTKIKNTVAYPIKQYPVTTDFFIGSDSQDNGTTVNFEIQSIVNMVSGLMDYTYSKSSIPLTSPEGDGYFLSNGIVDFNLITTLTVSKVTLSGQNLTPFLNFLKLNTPEFTLKLINKKTQNNFAYYSINVITEFADYFTFQVALAPGNNYLGTLIDKDIYTFVYEKIPGDGPELITQTITDGDTTHAPSGDAVFDALALKEDKINKIDVISGSSTVEYPSEKAVVDYVASQIGTDFAKIVYVNSTDPATASIFDLNNPPVTNDNALKNDIDNLYIGTDASTWVYKTSPAGYVTYTVVSYASNFYITGTNIDAGGVKTGSITKRGELVVDSESVGVSGFKLLQLPDKVLKTDSTGLIVGATFLQDVQYALDSNVIHKTGNEAKTGTLETVAFIKTGGLATEFLKADGSTSTLASLGVTTGTGANGQVTFWTGVTTQSGDNGLFWDNTNKRLTLGGIITPVGILSLKTGIASTYDLVNQEDTSISFSNVGAGTSSPTLSAKTTTNGFRIISGTNDVNSVFDMNFDIRESDNSDFSILTGSGFRWTRGGSVRMMELVRSGNLLLGTTVDDGTRLKVTGAISATTTITASTIVKIGGLPSQFLKADGSIDSTAYATTSHAATHISGGSDPIVGANLAVTTIPAPLNYTPVALTLQGQLLGIDQKLGTLSQTTAGITNRIYFTGDNTTVTAGTFFTSNAAGKGTVGSGTPQPSVVNGDNVKSFFTKDIISVATVAISFGPPGTYAGQLTVSATPTPAGTQQRFTIEVYKTNNGGTPIASGITGAPVGDLGVTVVAILDSGLVNLAAGALTNISLSGILASQLTLAVGERLRYHVSAAKVGAGGGNVTMNVYYGTSYNSFYDIPVTFNTDSVLNKSLVTGITTSDALNTLNTTKVGGTGTTNFISKWLSTGVQTDSQIQDNGTNIGYAGAPLATAKHAFYTSFVDLYSSSSGALATPPTQFLLNNAGATDGTFSLMRFAASRTSGQSAVTYLGTVNTTVNYESIFVIGRRTGSTSYEESLRIDNLGKVGISTNNPIGKLDIFTGTAGIIGNLAAMPFGTISFGNGGGSTALPTIYAKTDNSIGLRIIAGTNDTNPIPDMAFDVRRNDNNDFTVLTTPAFRFSRNTNTLIEILRNGNTTFLGSVTANSFIKTGGLATQYLMADGTTSTLTNPTTGTGVAGQVAFWNGTSVIAGDTGLVFDSASNILTTLNGGSYRTTKFVNGTQAAPNYEPIATYGFGTAFDAGLYGGNSLTTNNGMFLKLVVNSTTALNTPIDAMIIPATGFINIPLNVGIGTDAKSTSKLDLFGSKTTTYTSSLTTATNDFQRIFNNHNSGGTDQYSTLSLAVSGNNATNIAYVNLNAIQPTAANNTTDFSITLRQTNANTMTEVLRIKANGFIGFGTNSPDSDLHINASTNTAGIHITTSLTGSTAADGANFRVNSSSGLDIINRETTPIAIFTASTEAMRVTALRGVSIGSTAFNTTDPGLTNLAVQGTVSIGTSNAVGKLDVFTGLSGLTFNMVNQSIGSITMSNGTGASEAPTLTGKSNSNQYGIRFVAGTIDANTSTDMLLQVMENDGTDFSAPNLGSSAFRFARFSTTLIDILRNGNTTFSGNVVAANLVAGIYTPTLTATANVATLTFLNASYSRVGNIVTAIVGFSISCTTATSAQANFTVTLPINRTSSTGLNIGSGAVMRGTGATSAPVTVDSGSTTLAVVRVILDNTFEHTGTVTFQYPI